MNDINDYVGIPFVLRGRDREGIDCWGLVRLFYKEQLNIDLPSLLDIYVDDANPYAALSEQLAIKKEKWDTVHTPEFGDVVVLRYKGLPVHVGVYVGNGKFLHAFGKVNSVIEKLSSPKWKNRIEGFYRYNENCFDDSETETGVSVEGIAHPLKKVFVNETFQGDISVYDILRKCATNAGWPLDEDVDGIVWVNNRKVLKEEWKTYFPKAGDNLEFRLIAGKDGDLALIASIALTFAAPYAAVALFGEAAGTVSALTTLGKIASAGISILGTMLINAIFPVRPPKINTPAAGKDYYSLNAGGNQQNNYGAIPVVLGKYRFIPPLAAKPWVTVRNNEKYLRMPVVWGYGPLAVSSFRIGSTPLDKYDGVELETLTGVSGEDKHDFDAIYGKNITQVSIGVELEGGGDWLERTIDDDVSKIEVNFTAPAGLYSLSKSGNYGGIAVACKVKYKKVGSSTWYDFGSDIQGKSFNLPTNPASPYATYYTWHNVYVLDGNIKVTSGGTYTSKTTITTTEPVNNLYEEVSTDPKPAWPVGCRKLYQICISNSPGSIILVGDEAVAVDEIIDLREGMTGFDLTNTDLVFSVADGHIIDTTDEVTIKGAGPDPIDFVLTRTVPIGKYVVSVRRSTADYGAANINDRLSLTSITGISNKKPIRPRVPLAMSALEIKSSNQLNGNLEAFSAICQSICLDYVNETVGWVKQCTSNPASLYRYVLQHPANPRPKLDSEIDLAALADWHEYCKTNKFEYNNVIAGQMPVDDLLRDIAAAGRASPARPNGLYSVVIDRPISEISQHFTPHNSWGFSGAKRFPRLPHALRIGFANEDRDYQPDERVVYADGYNVSNATELESITLPGITNADVAYKHGRYHMAQAKLRPEEYTLNCDIEHIVCTRGDRVKVTHDVPLWGIGSGRIKSLILSGTDVAGVVLDESMQMQADALYALRYRRSSNGDSQEVLVTPVISSGDYDTIYFETLITTNKPAVNDLVMFGEVGFESVDCIIQNIEPSDNETAKITLVDYAPALAVVDTEEIPDWSSNITSPQSIIYQQILQKPENIAFTSDESAMEKASNNTYINNMLVKWTNPVPLADNIDSVEVHFKLSQADNNTWRRVISSANSLVAKISSVSVGNSYDVRLRYISNSGRAGEWVYSSHIVTGAIIPPDDVTGFVINIVGDVANLYWDQSSSINLSHYRIRYSPLTTGASWESSVDIIPRASKNSTSSTVVAMVGTYLIKAVDDDDRESENATSVISTIPGLTNLNAIETIDESGVWSGTKVNTWVSSGNLRLDSVDTMSDWSSLSSVVNLSYGVNGVSPSGYYQFVEEVGLGDIYTCRCSAEITLVAENVGNTMSSWVSLSDVISLSGEVGGLFDAWLEISTADDDDPSGSPTWSDWSKFVVGDYRARAFRFRLYLESRDIAVTPVISSAQIFIDMPDRIVSETNLLCPSSGMTVTYSSAFRARPAVAISAENMATGDYYAITSANESGFFIRFFNSSGTGISRTFDYLSKGYGAIIL